MESWSFADRTHGVAFEAMILKANVGGLVKAHVFSTSHHFFLFLWRAVDKSGPEADISSRTIRLRVGQTFHLISLALFIQSSAFAIFHAEIASVAQILYSGPRIEDNSLR